MIQIKTEKYVIYIKVEVVKNSALIKENCEGVLHFARIATYS